MGAVIPAFAGSGNNVYGQISSALDSHLYNDDSDALEAYNQSHWADYSISMPEQGQSGRYILTVPGGLPAGRYFVGVYLQSGGSPAAGDNPYDFVFFDWDGGNAIGVGSPLNMGAIAGSEPAATNLKATSLTPVVGAAVAGTLSTTQMTTNITNTIANVFAGRVIYFTSGGNLGRAALITAYAVTGGRLTFIAYNNQPITVAPSVADTFIVI